MINLGFFWIGTFLFLFWSNWGVSLIWIFTNFYSFELLKSWSMCNFITTVVSIAENYFSKVFGLTYGSLNQMTHPRSIWVLIFNYWKYGCRVPLNDNIFKPISLTIWKALYTLVRQKLPFGTFLFTLSNGFETLSNHWELALSLSLSLIWQTNWVSL